MVHARRWTVLLAAAGAVLLAFPLSGDPVPASIIHPPTGYSIEKDRALALSPDGIHVAFETRGLDPRLAVASTADPNDVHALPNTDGATSPFWSPDGRFVAFFRHGEMQRVDLDSRLQNICACNGTHGTWGSRGIIPRVSGWLGQWQELLTDSDQKISRPRQVYTGARKLDYVPVSKR